MSYDCKNRKWYNIIVESGHFETAPAVPLLSCNVDCE